jgi:hypothetical protein
MAVRQVGRAEFDEFRPARTVLTKQVYEEHEWYTVDAGNVLGAVVRHRADRDWGYAIYGRRKDGGFFLIEWERSLSSDSDARPRLRHRLEELERWGPSFFPWGSK